jgi:Ricin-type beta-trefoil lectin domain/CHAP domain
MNIRQVNTSRRSLRPSESKTSLPMYLKKYLLVAVIIAIGISWLSFGTSNAGPTGGPVKSGWSGYCLDDYKNKDTAGNQVDLWGCNNSEAQDWSVTMTQIRHGADGCLDASTDTKVVLSSCSDDPNQVWLRDGNGFMNPNDGLCLTAQQSGEDQPLNMASCGSPLTNSQAWSPAVMDNKCDGDQADKVACSAVREWINWQSNPNGHLALLNTYTGNAPYEEWCADFVSYIYKEAGYPFSNGNYGGWDENIASQIQNQGFTYHSANGYIPKPGDVAFFDYPGGHVEIVVSGGKVPTFVYGNSNTIDPTTNNGQMAANTILNEGAFGQIQYYLSPASQT